MAVFGASDALIGIRPRRWILALLAIVVPVLLGLTCELFHYQDYEIVVGVLVVGELVAFFLWPAIAPEDIGERRGQLKADREGLWFNKKLLVPRHRIDSGFIEGDPRGRPRVHLSTKRRRHQVWIDVEDEKAAEALLSALDLRHDRRAVSFEVESAPLRTESMQRTLKVLRLLGGVMLVVAVFYSADLNVLFGFTLVPVLVLYTLILRRLRGMTKISVGADGLSVRTGGKWREIPHREVTKVTRIDKKVVADTQKNGSLTFRFCGEGAHDRSDALATALRKGMHRAEADCASMTLSTTTSALACGGRTRVEWLSGLKRLTSGAAAEGAYRGGAIPDEDLWSIVEQPSADHEARAGALAALQPRLTEESRVRISEIAAATIQKDLKAALDAAANGESGEEILTAFKNAAIPLSK